MRYVAFNAEPFFCTEPTEPVFLLLIIQYVGHINARWHICKYLLFIFKKENRLRAN